MVFGDRVVCEAQGTGRHLQAARRHRRGIGSADQRGGTGPDDAPATHHENEADAQAARRGVWASLPPPPVPLKHPAVPRHGDAGR